MIALALRSMGQRKLRAALTAIAVLLGVAMIAGTYVQTDRIRNAFEGLEQTARQGTAAVITQREAFTSDFAPPKKLDESLVADVQRVPAVAQAAGMLQETGALVVDGKAVGSNFAPTLVISWVGEPFSPLEFTSGGPPSRPGDVAIDRKLAEDEDLSVGDRARVSTRIGTQPVRISGIAEYGNEQSIGGATLVVPMLSDVQRWFASRGEVSEIVVAAKPGVAPEQLVRDLRAALPRDLEIQTGQQSARETADEINDSLGSFLTPALLALSGAALLVGAFIIFNTFSITVAQRTREFALLRALGATRRQIVAAVAVEALAIGIAASVLGLLGGLGFAALLGALFDAAGWGLPSSGLVLATRTIVVALAVGVVVTLVSSIAPAMRATRVPPVAAMREDVAPPASARSRKLAPYAAGAVSVLGLAALLQGLFGAGPAAGRLAGLAVGAVLLFVGVALVSRYVVRPVAGAIGRPIERAFDEPGRLARENAMRNPGRTATTSAALMVGLGLVVFVSVFAAGLSASIDASMDARIRAEIIVSGKSFQPLPAGAGQTVQRTPGVGSTVALYGEQIEVDGKPVKTVTDTLDGVDPGRLLDVYDVKWVEGDDTLLGRLHGDTALVEEQFAKAHGIGVGDRFRIETASGGRATLTAIGEYDDPQILQGAVVDQATYERVSSLRDPFAYFVSTAQGADAAQVQSRVEDTLSRYPTAEVRSKDEYGQVIEDRLDQLVYLLYALLALCLVISLFGIANSLFLSIHERVREFGLLRAIGATQTQVRRIVRYESVITAVIGGVLGTLIGVLFAALATAALADLGLSFSLPVGQLLVFLVLAVLVGIAGAVVPARSAARVDVLDAMHYE